MKLFISADMEGISGIVDPTYIDPKYGVNYERGRRLMTDDVNAVVEAAVESGATEIIVTDSHSRMNNILIEHLHPKARLLSGSPRDHSMMQGLDSSFDAAFFIGYHTRHGVPGVLSHTMGRPIRNLYINGRVMGEFGFNAVCAGLYGVPVCLVSGDNLVAEEAKELIPGIATAVVKYAHSRTSALCLALEESRQELKQKTKEALAKRAQLSPVNVQVPLTCKIEFSHAGEAEMAAIVPGSMYETGSSEVTFVAQNQSELYRTMRAMLNLADTVQFT
ncbi:M55 family metallopeptidase [Brevibacillus massiliensis]|uniref:M55 family metallopeptidase n=1 Tax=Brevibacillus massiliensis TaxID=1118054 RepID=UPI0003014A2F|nr:M55 family metallopeptidase [Brevibacillus massiliensis]